MSKSKNKLTALFSTIKSIFEEFKVLNTDKGPLYYEDELQVGTILYTDSGVAADGEYQVDSTIYVVAGGAIVEIKEAEPAQEEPKPQEVPAPEELGRGKTDCAEETQEEPKPEPEPQVPSPEPKKDEEEEPDPIEEIKNAIFALKDQIATLENRITSIESRITDIEGTPATPTPHEEFSKLSGIEAVKAMRQSMRIK